MQTSTTCCSILELRQYTTRPGQRDVLLDLFDREFVETQEAHGMHVVGQFRDLGQPDRFVWMRGFRDMRCRGSALPAFYGGPVWAHHREAANATMIDSDNVLLLRPALPVTRLSHEALSRPRQGADAPSETIEVAVCPLTAPADDRLRRHLELSVFSELTDPNKQLLGCYVTEPAENNFPALPVRTDENVLVWMTTSGSTSTPATTDRVGRELISDLVAAVESFVAGPPETIHLSPSPRSQLR